MKMENPYLSGFMAGAILFFLAGGLLGVYLEEREMRSQAIERGFAIYHPVTADFTWVDAPAINR